tara:strand:- start:29656 stop:30360 length:705 start_codon:yes stop_codon:yes gene_type:complete
MLNKRAKYGGDWGVPSAEHPAGECLNRSAPGAEDGSYFEKSWVNDLMALSGALMNSAGYSPNGTEDTATACQVFDALINSKWSPIGNYSVGVIVRASNGKQYYCNKPSGRDTTPINPETDTLDNWREYPAKSTTTTEYHVVEYFDGRVEVSFSGPLSDVNGVSVCVIPLGIEMIDAEYLVQTSEVSSTTDPSLVQFFGVVRDGKTRTSFKTICVDSSGSAKQNESPKLFISYRK